MSRVIYANTASTPEQESLRTDHGVRLVAEADEGRGVDALPAGTYGFTYSPALSNAPLFQTRRFRSFEIHKLPDGEVAIIGFMSADDALALASGASDAQVRVQPEPEPDANHLVIVPYSRIRHHQQYAVRTEHGLTLRVSAAS